jgi:hypothetical protein
MGHAIGLWDVGRSVATLPWTSAHPAVRDSLRRSPLFFLAGIDLCLLRPTSYVLTSYGFLVFHILRFLQALSC